MNTHVCTHMHMQTHVCVHTNTYLHTHERSHIHKHAHTATHVHIPHTHTQAPMSTCLRAHDYGVMILAFLCHPGNIPYTKAVCNSEGPSRQRLFFWSDFNSVSHGVRTGRAVVTTPPLDCPTECFVSRGSFTFMNKPLTVFYNL